MATACRETVVDGYNLIHKLWKPGREASMATLRDRLETLLAAYRKRTRRHVTIVYDGGGTPGAISHSGAVEVVFSGSADNADRRIVDIVRSLGRRSGLVTVVSSDLEIRQHVIAWGATWTSSESFAAELGRLGILPDSAVRLPSGPAHGRARNNGARPLDDDEVARWMKLFGEGG